MCTVVFTSSSVDRPVAQPTVSKHWMDKYHIPWTCLPRAHPGVFKLCLWPLIAPGYLGGQLPCLSSAIWCQYPQKSRVRSNHSIKFNKDLVSSFWVTLFTYKPPRTIEKWTYLLIYLQTDKKSKQTDTGENKFLSRGIRDAEIWLVIDCFVYGQRHDTSPPRTKLLRKLSYFVRAQKRTDVGRWGQDIHFLLTYFCEFFLSVSYH